MPSENATLHFCVFFILHAVHYKACSDADLVDLHSVRVLQDEELALCPDQTGDGVDRLAVLAGLRWDLRGSAGCGLIPSIRTMPDVRRRSDTYRSISVSCVNSSIKEILEERPAVSSDSPHGGHGPDG